ncbi:Dabb family protein [Microbacterium sp. F51-2R]|uniref:Dabb family protein n=1 Tax=Microbacterium sp. F51-2R TaxID=3445777 RepID=UPI003FA14C9D
MITHTVVFRLRRPVDSDVEKRFHETVRAFGADPPHALGPAQVLTDAQLRPEGRSVSESGLVVQFSDADAFAAYLVDPQHVHFVENALVPFCETWLAIQTSD